MDKFDNIINKSTEISNFDYHDPQQEWEDFLNVLQEANPKEQLPKSIIIKKNHSKIYYISRAIAAVFVIALLFIYTLKSKDHSRIQYQAAHDGEVIQLIDGSTITLAANAILDYPKNFNNQSTRYLILQGNATFDVAKSILPFKVSYDSILVEVLGTKFSLSQHNNSVIIQNLEGSVKVSSKNNPTNYVILKAQDQFLYSNGQFINKLGKDETTEQESKMDADQLETNDQRSSISNPVGKISTYKLGSVLKNFLVKRNKKTIKIDKHFKYNPEEKVNLNLQLPIEKIILSLKDQGIIGVKQGKCQDCIIITSPEQQK